jgi:GAF domain-containing protein
VVAAPLVEGERVLGVLSSRHDADAATDPVRRETAAAAATRLAEALVRVRLLTEAVDSSHRLAVLQDLTSRLGRATTTAAVVDLVLQGVRRQFGASAAGLFLPDPSGVLRRRGTVGPAPEDLSGPSDVVPTDGGPVAAAVAEQRPRYGPTPHPAVAAAADPSCPDPEAPSWAVLPLVFNRRLRGVAWFAWPAGARPGPEDRALHEAFAEQCAAALRRVTATDAEHDVAIKLQQALLPQRFPAVDGVAAAARYVPSSEALSVGGDWYDVVARPDGRVVVVVGDVVGHDVTAAAAMGRLRSSLATIAVDAPDPAAAVRRVHGFPGGPDIGFATALYLDFDPVTGVLRYSCAGHPPPLLVKPWGEAEFLMSGRSGPLFAAEPRDVRSGAVTVPAASLVVCYTDGLVERRDRRFHDGLVGLARSCLRHRHRPLPAFTDGVLADLTAGRRLADDVALLCAVLTPRTGTVRSPRPPATPSVAAAAGPGPPPTRA